MSDDDLDVTPTVLRNRGVPILMNVIVRDALPLPEGTPQAAADAITNILGPPRLIYGDDGEPLTVIEHLRFDMNAIAAIEEAWDGLTNWQVDLSMKPVTAMRRTIAIAMLRDPNEIGMALIAQRQGEYGAAIGAAWAIANGVDPTQAAQGMIVARDAVAKQIEKQQEALARTIETIESSEASPGATGSESGVT
jgi:hypothetical protein